MKKGTALIATLVLAGVVALSGCGSNYEDETAGAGG